MNRQEFTWFSEDYIRSCLNQYLSESNPIYTFGSFARNDARWNAGYVLSANVMHITNEIDESFIPLKVDIA